MRLQPRSKETENRMEAAVQRPRGPCGRWFLTCCDRPSTGDKAQASFNLPMWETEPRPLTRPGQETEPWPLTHPGQETEPWPLTHPGQETEPGRLIRPVQETGPGPRTCLIEDTEPWPLACPGQETEPGPFSCLVQGTECQVLRASGSRVRRGSSNSDWSTDQQCDLSRYLPSLGLVSSATKCG